MEEVKSKKPTKKQSRSLNPKLLALVMFLLGALTLFAIRFATFQSDDVHYHANFALYVNGQRDEFKGFTFYEEVASCNVHDENDVKARVHMHNENPGLVHVHANGVTWSQFFTNIGYTLGNTVLVTRSGTFVDGQDGKKLTFILNGETVNTIQNTVIKSTDRLLINYGNEAADTLKSHFDSVPNDADAANKTNDPAACSGSHESSMSQRLKAAAGLQTH